MFAQIVYLLCAATSLLCAVLLLRGYWTGRARLLLWSGLCFVFLALDNVLLFVDEVLIPEVDVGLVLARRFAALSGLALLLYGLVFDLK
jgi:hypothetical protein